ncbi:MAG TPA: hypothetical protein PJ992_08395 [Arachnia sp.]|nr:hypothetical protein [Arachnia sp.]HMR13693.1 hypothetical protein [Arachnia sp.]
MADDAPSPLAHARFLPNGGDRFLGFWLGLSVEGRAGGISSGERGARRIIDAFLCEHGKTVDAVGEEAFFDELRDAAERYWATCIDDSAYGSTLFGMKRLPKDELAGKMANDAAATLAVIVGSRAKSAGAARLPRAMIDGYLGAVPQGQPTLRAALAKRPKVLAEVGHLLDPFAER